MPKSFINVDFGGHISKAEVKDWGSRQILRVSFATEGQKKKDSEEHWPTKWWDVEASEWPSVPSKGDYIAGSGMMSYDEKDGKRYYKVKFGKITEVTPKQAREQQTKPIPVNVHNQHITDDDIPF